MIDSPPAIICQAPRAVDGDTIRCANLPVRVRLLGIDAPELPGHCRKGRTCTPGDGARSTRILAGLLAAGRITVHPSGQDRYGRMLATASLTLHRGRIDLSCQMLKLQAAVPRYSRLNCRG